MEEEEPFTRITLRLPNALHEKISKATAGTGMSRNAEIVSRLEQSFSANEREALVDELKSLLAERDRQILEESIQAALQRLLGETKAAKKK